MTIEELREMRGAIGTLAYWNGETAEPLTPKNGLYKSLLALIDAEIAKQSVTNEDVDVQQAIKEIELINHHEFAIWEKRTVDALNIAIEALRQYRKPEPCDMCKRDENGAGIIVDNMWKWNSETKKRYPMLAGGLANYCPRCGRKLEQ